MSAAVRDILVGATEHPDRVAVTDASGSVTYATLLRRAQALAVSLREVHAAVDDDRGTLLGPSTPAAQADLAEARVAILVAPGAEWVIVLWAVWLAGGIAVPLAPQHPAAEWAYVLEDSGARLLLADAEHGPLVREVAAAAGALVVPVSSDVGARKTHDAHAALTLPPTRRALILYTSGTTGKPKGVVHTHGSLAAQVASLVAAWEWVATDHTLLVLPLHHVHGVVNVVCCALAVGACVTVLPRFDASAVWQLLHSGQVTVLHAVPTIWRRLVEWTETVDEPTRAQCRSASAAMRLLVSGSAALPVSLLDRWQALSGHVLLERYGMTEIGMALSNPLHGQRVPGQVGQALPGVQLRAVDEHGEPVAPGQAGRLEVRGDTVMREYWRRPAETAAAFRDGWFLTGDIAVQENTPAGPSWRLLGRESQDIIKTGGYKVSALEIEEVVRLHSAVRECAVVGLPDAEWGECVAVAVELTHPNATPAFTLDALRQFVKTHLAAYKVPTRLQVVPTLPRNAMGKVVKADVRTGFA